MLNAYGNEESVTKEDILDTLDSGRIVSIKLKDNKFIIREECDGYFSAELSREEFLFLIQSMQELYERSE